MRRILLIAALPVCAALVGCSHTEVTRTVERTERTERVVDKQPVVTGDQPAAPASSDKEETTKTTEEKIAKPPETIVQ